MLLFGVGYFAPDDTNLKPLLLPDNLGSATVYLILAYAVGHLLQGLGNLFENGYWRIWNGVPTDWPYSHPNPQFPACDKTQIETIVKQEVSTIEEWHRAAAKVRSIITAKGLTSRLDVFNGNYGMFRGIVVVGIIFLATAWKLADDDVVSTYFVIAVVTGLAMARMHRFAKHYGKEFFACVGTLSLGEAATQPSQSTKVIQAKQEEKEGSTEESE